MLLPLAFLPIEKVSDGLQAVIANLAGELVIVLESFRYCYV